MKKLYCLLLLACLGSGCKKILDKEPQNQLSLEETFSTMTGAKAALLGAYSSFYTTPYYNALRMIYPEVMGGNTKYSRTSNLDLLSEYDFSSSAVDGGMNATYSSIYESLNNLNNIIKYAPAVADGSKLSKNRMIAEATVLRALAHYDLLQLYAQQYNFTSDASHPGIVLALETIVANKTVIQRSSVKVCYDAIINDLKNAISLFNNSERLFTSGNTANYASSNLANALLARIYLNMGDWQNAYNAADTLIASKTYTLFSNANYVGSWALKNTTESIFELPVPTTFSGNSYGNYFDVVNGGNYLQMAATDDLMNLYSSTDVRGKSKLYTSKVTNDVTYYYSAKYATSGTNATGIKVFRLSEMYLIRAEAAAELNNLTQANTDLNVIRGRADLSATLLSITGKQTLIDAILLERRKELSFEGFLLFDLARRKQNIVRTDCQALACNLNYPAARYVLPIPEGSVVTNPLMVQNPEY